MERSRAVRRVHRWAMDYAKTRSAAWRGGKSKETGGRHSAEGLRSNAQRGGKLETRRAQRQEECLHLQEPPTTSLDDSTSRRALHA